ncbi:hypothetical protein CEK62_15450 [Alcanivorax sp. N3-2A]|nr:hypothetical protein CEK62_15450 [Alcanivorax sp. N3-2A]
MRAETLRRHIDLHAWVGIVSGLALFVAFFAGALNMFHHELHHWQEPRGQQATPADHAGLQTLLDKVLQADPHAGTWLYMIPGDEPTVIWHERVDGQDIWHTSYAGDFASNGEYQERTRSSLAEFVNELHYELAIPKVGLWLMGLISVLYGAALIGGLIIHWPKMKRELFALKHQGNVRRYWKNLHNLVGVISFPFHLIFAVTGAAMGCLALITVVLGALVFGPQLQGAITDATEAWPTPEASGETVAMAGIGRYLARAEQALPGMRVDWIELQQYGDKNATVDVAGSVRGYVAHHAHVVMKGSDAEQLTITAPGARPFNHAVLSPIYSLHFGDYGGGDYGGLFLRVIYFVLALLGCLLFFSGNVMWAERRTDRHGPSRSAAFTLRLTLGVTYGVMAGLAVSFIANKVVMHSPWASAVVVAEKGGFVTLLLAALLCAFRFTPLGVTRVWLPLSALLYLLAPLVQGVIEGFTSWADPDIGLVSGALLAVAASLFAVDRLRARRLRRAGAHPLWEVRRQRRIATIAEPV